MASPNPLVVVVLKVWNTEEMRRRLSSVLTDAELIKTSVFGS